MKRHPWHWHPQVRTGADLTFGERAADAMRNGFGTWSFLGLFTGLLIGWVVSGGFGFDPSPFFRLNLALSCLAGLQGAIILLAQKRSDKIAAEAAEHHYHEGEQMADLLRQNTTLTEKVAELTAAVHAVVTGTPQAAEEAS